MVYTHRYVLARNTVNITKDMSTILERLCGPVVRVLGYSSGGPGSIPGTTKKK
jgi:hypothetical protein